MEKEEYRILRLEIANVYLDKCYSSVYFIAIITAASFAVYYFYPNRFLFILLPIYVISELFNIRNNRRKYLHNKKQSERAI